MYEPKAITKTISATSRASVKIRESFYTLEYSEERVIPDIEGIDLDAERRALWDTCNIEVDNQIRDVIEANKNNR